MRGDLIQSFKIFNNIDDVDRTEFFKLTNYDKTRNNTDKIFIEYCKTNIRKFYFTNRIAHVWNRLPNEIKRAQNTNSFKNQLDHWKHYIELKFEYDE